MSDDKPQDYNRLRIAQLLRENERLRAALVSIKETAEFRSVSYDIFIEAREALRDE